jgi:Asp-tRNA(Asn)/Glu-tRNA(Gln) amidotransferase A subunit family amidase
LHLENMVSKKWYNLFVSVDAPPGGAEEGDSAGAPRGGTDAARMVAEIAASVPAVSTFAAEVKDPASFPEIYDAAEIATPAHGYTILKVAGMLQSEHLRGLSPEVKRSSILVALEAAGAKVDDIIQDAVRRDRALDSFENVLSKSRAGVEAAKIEENRKIEAEMNKMLAEYRARIQANNETVTKENERFAAWQTKKQAEERTIADAVSYFVSENPITVSGAPAAANTPAKPGK